MSSGRSRSGGRRSGKTLSQRANRKFPWNVELGAAEIGFQRLSFTARMTDDIRRVRIVFFAVERDYSDAVIWNHRRQNIRDRLQHAL
jgi:hypothetical protein